MKVIAIIAGFVAASIVFVSGMTGVVLAAHYGTHFIDESLPPFLGWSRNDEGITVLGFIYRGLIVAFGFAVIGISIHIAYNSSTFEKKK